MRGAPAYSAESIERIGSEVAEAIELATLGREGWQHVTDTIVSAFPGSFCALMNQDFAHDRVITAEHSGIEPAMMDAFETHFAFINPWSSLWTSVPDGAALLSERDFPARTLVGTEFYHDWVVPTERPAAAGLKIDAAPDETVYLPLHYPLNMAPAYDAPAERVMALLTGPFRRAVQHSAFLRESTERGMSAAALVAHSDEVSFVVDGRMRLVEASQAAVDMMARGSLLRCGGNRIHFADPAFSAKMASMARDLERSVTSEPVRTLWACDGERWIVRLFRISPIISGRLIAARPLILVLMKGLRHSPPGNLAGFEELFGLTPAEMRLCAGLARGHTLADAAIGCGIANDTARDRLKSIFGKTQTSRQAELCVLLTRYLSV